MSTYPDIVELRRYRLVPGQRETLIDLFDRELVETQEAEGMQVLGQFRDPERPDTFVWVRGFTDMESRHRGLTVFYTGPVWARHGPAANPTMIDFSDVLLLRPLDPSVRLSARDEPAPRRRVTCWIATFQRQPADDHRDRWLTTAKALARETGAHWLGGFETEPSANTFARLPVREDGWSWVALAATDGDDDPFAGLDDGFPADRIELLDWRPTDRSRLR